MRGENLSHATSIRFTARAVRDWQQSKTRPVFSCEVLTTTTTINGSSPDMRNGDFVAGRGAAWARFANRKGSGTRASLFGTSRHCDR